jgi:hypothetical protein
MTPESKPTPEHLLGGSNLSAQFRFAAGAPSCLSAEIFHFRVMSLSPSSNMQVMTSLKTIVKKNLRIAPEIFS